MTYDVYTCTCNNNKQWYNYGETMVKLWIHNYHVLNIREINHSNKCHFTFILYNIIIVEHVKAMYVVVILFGYLCIWKYFHVIPRAILI